MDQPPALAKDRNAAMDAARGIAVLGMIFIHLIPTEGAVTTAGQLATGLAAQLSGKPAALFFVLAGMAWALQQRRSGWTQPYIVYMLKRSLALVVIGLLLHLLIWPTEVLTSLGVTFPIAALIFSRGERAIWTSLALLVMAVPLLSHGLHDWSVRDWADGGEPKLSLASSVRLLLFDGDYPLMPWLAFVLIGMLIVQIKTKFAAWAAASLVISLATLLLVTLTRPEPGSSLSVDWTPTTLPFLLVCGGFALATVFGLSWVTHAEFRIWKPLRCVGAMSLTHYVGHIALLILPLRHFFPEEDWPTRLGIACLTLYVLTASVFSTVWLSHYRRGPLESMLARITGSPGSTSLA